MLGDDKACEGWLSALLRDRALDALLAAVDLLPSRVDEAVVSAGFGYGAAELHTMRANPWPSGPRRCPSTWPRSWLSAVSGQRPWFIGCYRILSNCWGWGWPAWRHRLLLLALGDHCASLLTMARVAQLSRVEPAPKGALLCDPRLEGLWRQNRTQHADWAMESAENTKAPCTPTALSYWTAAHSTFSLTHDLLNIGVGHEAT